MWAGLNSAELIALFKESECLFFCKTNFICCPSTAIRAVCPHQQLVFLCCFFHLCCLFMNLFVTLFFGWLSSRDGEGRRGGGVRGREREEIRERERGCGGGGGVVVVVVVVVMNVLATQWQFQVSCVFIVFSASLISFLILCGFLFMF